MGQKLSTDVVSKSVINSIVETMTSTMQRTKNRLSVSQKLELDCSESMISQTQINMTKCMVELAGQMDALEVGKLCQQRNMCSADHISFDSVVEMTITTDQKMSIKTAIDTTIKQKIKSAIEAETGAVISDVNVKKNLTAVTNNITRISKQLVQDVYNHTSLAQTVTLKNGSASYISFTSVTTLIANSIQQNDVVMKSVTDLSNSVVDKVSTTSKMRDTLINVGVFALVMMLALGIFLFVLKKTSWAKRRKTRKTRNTVLVARNPVPTGIPTGIRTQDPFMTPVPVIFPATRQRRTSPATRQIVSDFKEMEIVDYNKKA